MVSYTPDTSTFSDSINITETTDLAHATNINDAPKQLIENDIALKKEIDELNKPATTGSGYGTCDTAASTLAKVVSLADYKLVKNGIIAVKFTYAVPASATLNINSKGAKAIYNRGAAITADVIEAGDIATFIYDGTHYNVLCIDKASTLRGIETFTSSDALAPTDFTTMPGVLSSGETRKTIFQKLSIGMKNLRYIIGLLGTTDISELGGTLTEAVANLNEREKALRDHNIPRLFPKDITEYYNDDSIWDRLNGTNGYEKYEDIFAGDYFKMSRAISAYERTGTYQATGSQWVTIAGISSLWCNGDTAAMQYEHLVMVPGKGLDTTEPFHFGRSRMNSTNTTVGGYVASEMHATTLGAVTSTGSTASTASINQQLYAEFGAHLKTTRELLSNSLNSTGYNRFGSNAGCTNNWAWTDCQAVLMSEVEVYGATVWSSSGYDTGNACVQLPLFRDKRFVNNRTAYYWLKDVASATHFCRCSSNGYATDGAASSADYYVRPRFVIAA